MSVTAADVAPPPLAEYVDPHRAIVAPREGLGFELRARFPRGEIIIMRGERLASLMVHDPPLNERIAPDACAALGDVHAAVLDGTVDRAEWADGLGRALDLEIELVNLTAATRDEALAVLRFALGDDVVAEAVAQAGDRAFTPWAWHKPLELPPALTDSGASGFDLRLATLHVYELAYAQRGVRMLIADRWLITLWGEPVGDDWVEYEGHHALPGHYERDYAGRTAVVGTDGHARAARYLQDIHWHHLWASNVLGARLEAWEARFYAAAAGDPESSAAAMRDLQNELARVGAFLSDLRLATRTMRRRAPYAYFPQSIKPETAAVCRELAEEVRGHGGDIRDGFALLTSVASARQTEIATERQTRDRDFQAAVQFIAAIILVPTLVVGAYGANVVGLPGAQTRSGLTFMALAAILGAVLTAAYLHWRPGVHTVVARLRPESAAGGTQQRRDR